MSDIKATPRRWQSGSSEEARRLNSDTLKSVTEAVRSGDGNAIQSAFDGWTPSEVLACLVAMRTKEARRLLSWLPEDIGMRVLAEIDPRFHVVLYEDATRSKFKKLIRRLTPPAALRLLEELPDAYAEELLVEREDAEKLRAALANDRDTAAAVMHHHAMTIPAHWTIGDVVEDIRARSDQIEKIDSLHVIAPDRTLLGYLRIRDLLHHPAGTPVADVARPDPVTVSPETDKEEVLALATRRNIPVLAVTDRDGHFLGAITPRELTEIAQDEAEEDMLVRAGVNPDATAFDTPLQIVRRRAPWLLIGLMGALIAAVAVGSFEHALTEAAILATFIPVVMATAGNAGMQASTMAIQSMSGDQEWRGDFWPRVFRELAGATMNGVLVGIFVVFAVLLASLVTDIDRPAQLSVTAAIALLLVTMVTGTFGAIIPVVLRAAKIDPAVATGIFITTASDVFGVLIFFFVATALYL